MDEKKGFKITRRALDAFRPSDRSPQGTKHADCELPGFYVAAYPERLSFAVR